MSNEPKSANAARLVSVNEYAAEYYFAGDGGDYTPNEFERCMIEDAIHGYLSQLDDAERALQARSAKL